MKSLRYGFYMIILCCIVLCNTGCEKTDVSEMTPTALIILAGNHANSCCFDVELSGTISEVYSSFGNIGIVVVDGVPEPLYEKDHTNFVGCYSADYLSESKEQYITNDAFWEKDYFYPQIKKLTGELNVCQADDPEVNTLEALHTAVEMLNTIENSMGTSIKKEIIVLDTGVCTEGAVNFQNSEYLELLSYEEMLCENDAMKDKVDELILDLNRRAEIPNLEGISVTWYGIGEVSEPQEPLSRVRNQNLQYIWGELLTKAGASPSNKINADEKYGIFVTVSTHESMTSGQYVTPIILDKDCGDVVEKPELPKAEVYFQANKDELLFPEKIDDTLEPYITAFQKNEGCRILLIGKTSSYNGGSVELSQKRTERVKKAMIKNGISEESIITIGVGYNLEFCKNDSPKGEFEEEIAKMNRSVIILQYDSQEAQDILSKV